MAFIPEGQQMSRQPAATIDIRSVEAVVPVAANHPLERYLTCVMAANSTIFVDFAVIKLLDSLFNVFWRVRVRRCLVHSAKARDPETTQ